MLVVLVVAPATTYGIVMFVTDGTGIMRENWEWLVLVLPPIFTTFAGVGTSRSGTRIVVASVASILMTVGLFVVLFMIALSKNPGIFQ